MPLTKEVMEAIAVIARAFNCAVDELKETVNEELPRLADKSHRYTEIFCATGFPVQIFGGYMRLQPVWEDRCDRTEKTLVLSIVLTAMDTAGVREVL